MEALLVKIVVILLVALAWLVWYRIHHPPYRARQPLRTPAEYIVASGDM